MFTVGDVVKVKHDTVVSTRYNLDDQAGVVRDVVHGIYTVELSDGLWEFDENELERSDKEVSDYYRLRESTKGA